MSETRTLRNMGVCGFMWLPGAFVPSVGKKANALLDAPIVRCGDSSVVLDVGNREELAEALFDDDVKDAGADDIWDGLTEDQRDLWRGGVDAILSKLKLREVEEVVTLQ